jgi:hypothetical protein
MPPQPEVVVTSTVHCRRHSLDTTQQPTITALLESMRVYSLSMRSACKVMYGVQQHLLGSCPPMTSSAISCSGWPVVPPPSTSFKEVRKPLCTCRAEQTRSAEVAQQHSSHQLVCPFCAAGRTPCAPAADETCDTATAARRQVSCSHHTSALPVCLHLHDSRAMRRSMRRSNIYWTS